MTQSKRVSVVRPSQSSARRQRQPRRLQSSLSAVPARSADAKLSADANHSFLERKKTPRVRSSSELASLVWSWVPRLCDRCQLSAVLDSSGELPKVTDFPDVLGQRIRQSLCTADVLTLRVRKSSFPGKLKTNCYFLTRENALRLFNPTQIFIIYFYVVIIMFFLIP